VPVTSQKLDLHVHTPASADYLGDKSDSEYISLLRQSKESEIAAIAITDHNTINGCTTFERLRQEVKLNFDLNSKRGGPREFLDQLKEEVLLFETVGIINAVEVSVYPKIHLLLLFSETIPPSAIADFLKTDLALGEAVTKGSPDIYCKLAPTAVLDLATEKFANNFFCILPHVDSSNGAWNELSGAPRAELFCKPQVLAAQVLSPDTKKHFIETYFVLKNTNANRNCA
jgi:hypothetical protein